jgi:hypothetical protein
MQGLPSHDNHGTRVNNDNDNDNCRPNYDNYLDGRRLTRSYYNHNYRSLDGRRVTGSYYNYNYSIEAEARALLSALGVQSGGMKTAPSFARNPLQPRTSHAIA